VICELPERGRWWTLPAILTRTSSWALVPANPRSLGSNTRASYNKAIQSVKADASDPLPAHELQGCCLRTMCSLRARMLIFNRLSCWGPSLSGLRTCGRTDVTNTLAWDECIVRTDYQFVNLELSKLIVTQSLETTSMAWRCER
jgi:hypothetical protein